VVVCQEKYTTTCCIGRTGIWVAVRSDCRSNLKTDTVGAKNFARIFYRNAFNMGLLILECEDTDKFQAGDKLTVDFDTGAIIHTATKKSYQSRPIPPFMQELVQSGGLLVLCGFYQSIFKIELSICQNVTVSQVF